MFCVALCSRSLHPARAVKIIYPRPAHAPATLGSCSPRALLTLSPCSALLAARYCNLSLRAAHATHALSPRSLRKPALRS
eukprot:5866694-Lingulodinium_polyedra.AAC.1